MTSAAHFEATTDETPRGGDGDVNERGNIAEHSQATHY